MYAYLRGKVAVKLLDYIVVDVTGVGYKVYLPQRMNGPLVLNEETTVYTHLQVREDDLSLYGFTDVETLTLFELLLTVSGIGPKVALSIVNHTEANPFYQAILNDKIAVLTKLPGVGKKTAQRLVLELKEKIAALAVDVAALGSGTELPGDATDVADQASAALMSLGYRPEEAAGALRHVLQSEPEQASSLDNLLRAALKRLGSR